MMTDQTNELSIPHLMSYYQIFVEYMLFNIYIHYKHLFHFTNQATETICIMESEPDVVSLIPKTRHIYYYYYYCCWQYQFKTVKQSK